MQQKSITKTLSANKIKRILAKNCLECNGLLSENGYVLPQKIEVPVEDYKKITVLNTICLKCFEKRRQADFDMLNNVIFGKPNQSVDSFDDMVKLTDKIKKGKKK